MIIPKNYRELFPGELLRSGDKFWSTIKNNFEPMAPSVRVGEAYLQPKDGIYIRYCTPKEQIFLDYLSEFIKNEQYWGVGFTKEKILITYTISLKSNDELKTFLETNGLGYPVNKLKKKHFDLYEECMNYIMGEVAKELVLKKQYY